MDETVILTIISMIQIQIGTIYLMHATQTLMAIELAAMIYPIDKRPQPRLLGE